MKVSEFLKWNADPFLLGCFFSRIVENNENDIKYFYAYVDFRESKVGNDKQFDFREYVDDMLVQDLNSISSPKNWVNAHEIKKVGKGFGNKKAYYVLENDLLMSTKSFFDKLYFKVLEMEFATDENFNEQKADFIRGFIESRGSIDATAYYIANDYYYNSQTELKKVRILTERMNVPSNVINLNFRELQKQYREGINKRNTQLRINVHWFASTIGFINKYKSYLYTVVHSNKVVNIRNNIQYHSKKYNPSPETINTQFSSYLDLYSDHIYNKELTKADIENLRKSLSFDTVTTSNTARNTYIRNLFQQTTPDVCAGCGVEITSTNKRTGLQNFEIHHFIPYKNNPAVLDNIDNLVKLCAICHDSLSKGRSTEYEQVQLITNIMGYSPVVKEFAGSYLGLDDEAEIAEQVQKLLL